MKNKVLSKYLLSSYIYGATALAIAGISVKQIQKEMKFANENRDKPQVVQKSTDNTFYCLLAAVLALVISGFCLEVYPKTVKNTVNQLTKEYLANFFIRHPEMKKFNSVLNDTKKIQEIVAVACNSLSQDEQKQMLRILRNSRNTETAEKAILSLIQKHAMENPGYIESIMSVITSDKTYVMSANQKTR